MFELNLRIILFFIGGIIVAFLLGLFIGKILRYKEIKKQRKDSTKRSRSVILGEVYEKVLPFLPDFPYNPKDMVFVGKGVDYIIFDGLSGGNLKQVLFLEVKSGKSNLNKNERQIRDCIKSGKIKYDLYRVKK